MWTFPPANVRSGNEGQEPGEVTLACDIAVEDIDGDDSHTNSAAFPRTCQEIQSRGRCLTESLLSTKPILAGTPPHHSQRKSPCHQYMDFSTQYAHHQHCYQKSKTHAYNKVIHSQRGLHDILRNQRPCTTRGIPSWIFPLEQNLHRFVRKALEKLSGY